MVGTKAARRITGANNMIKLLLGILGMGNGASLTPRGVHGEHPHGLNLRALCLFSSESPRGIFCVTRY
jgi:hypothetical protein